MSRVAKLVLAILLAPVAAVFAIVGGLLIWGYSLFPDDASAPDSSTVAPNVLAGFERHLDANRDWYATRLFLHRGNRTLSQREFNVAGVTAQLWLSAFWTSSQRIAEITQRAYLGHGFYGVENAAQGYFGRPSEHLRPEEVAALAFLTRAPSSTSPWCRRTAFVRRVSVVQSLSEIDPALMLENLLPPPEGACEPAA